MQKTKLNKTATIISSEKLPLTIVEPVTIDRGKELSALVNALDSFIRANASMLVNGEAVGYTASQKSFKGLVKQLGGSTPADSKTKNPIDRTISKY